MRMRFLLGFTALVAIQIALVALCNRLDQSRERAALPVHVEYRSQPASNLVVERPEGEKLVLRSRSGRFQLVHFWATWCPPCRKEFPTLLEMARRNRGRLDVWAVSTDREWSAVHHFFKGDVPSIVVRDLRAEGSHAYRVTSLPDSYLIDPQGRIRARFSGAQNWSAGEMGRILDQLMGSS